MEELQASVAARGRTQALVVELKQELLQCQSCLDMERDEREHTAAQLAAATARADATASEKRALLRERAFILV